MTLSRQLFLGIAVAFLVLLAGIEAIYVHTARRHLAEQLDAHANETATSLALTIGSRMQAMDATFVNTIVNPVFDRGHFESIEVRAADGSVVLLRRLDARQGELPGWFVRLVALEPPTGQSLISAGWRQLGRVIVRVHPQYAYLQLWDTAIATLTWLGVLFAAALVAMRFYLGGILRPLRLIELAAVAIGNRQFVTIGIEPHARELQQVTHAINSLSSKIRDEISLETARAEQLRREAFEDPMTGQLNRRGFENAVSAALAKSAEVHSGALALLAVSGLEDLNRAVGLSKGNDVLKRLSDTLVGADVADARVVGRWQGPSFAVFFPNGVRNEVTDWAERVCKDFVAGLHASGLPESVLAHAGIAHFSGEATTLPALGRLAETALGQAAASGGAALSLELAASGEHLDLKFEIESALAADRVSLLFQRVVSIPGNEVLQFEFLAKLGDSQGNAISGAAFVPVASQHGLLPVLDRRVVELAIGALQRAKNLPGTVSVNVALQSVLDEAFRAKLQALLKGNPREARRIVFEMTGAAASKSPDVTRRFAAELRAAGSQLALDNFEMERNAVALVHALMPAYVKLAPVFTREIGSRADSRFILETMLRVFRPLEIPVIAQGVEDPELVAILAEVGVAGYQGYVLGKPEPLAD